jgi:hypothetical protein
MESFVRRENIKRYRRLLREAQDEPARRRILKLLAEAEKEEDVAGQAPGLTPQGRNNGHPRRSRHPSDEED